MGDICYLCIQPHDSDQIYVTASTEGYFINKVSAALSCLSITFCQGMSQGQILYDKAGELCSTLVVLLKSCSQHFVNRIMQQVKLCSCKCFHKTTLGVLVNGRQL